jgi:hypothetical protein
VPPPVQGVVEEASEMKIRVVEVEIVPSWEKVIGPRVTPRVN